MMKRLIDGVLYNIHIIIVLSDDGNNEEDAKPIIRNTQDDLASVLLQVPSFMNIFATYFLSLDHDPVFHTL